MLKQYLKHKKVFKYLTAAIIIFVALYQKFPTIRIPGTFVSVRLEDFLLVAAFLLVFFEFVGKIDKFLKNDLYKAIVLYLLVGLASLASGIFVTKTVVAHIGILHWIRRVEYFVPLFLGYLAIKKDKENLSFFLKIFMIVFFIAFIYGLGQRYLEWPIIITQNEEYSRGVALRYRPGSHINSTFAGHYDLGTLLVFTLPIFISLFLTLKEKKAKIAAFLTITFGLWLLAYSGSRVSVVSYLIAVSVSLFVLKKVSKIPLVLVFSLVFFAISPNLLARYSRIFQVTVDKIKQINYLNYQPYPKEVLAQTPEALVPKRQIATPTPTQIPVFEDRSTSIRLNVEWPRAVRAFLKNPIFGTGYSSITLATDNDYLRMFGETGLLGFLAFILIFLRLFLIIVEKIPLQNNFKGIELAYSAGVIGGLSGVFLNAIFIDIFEASKFAILFWMMIGFFLGIANKDRK